MLETWRVSLVCVQIADDFHLLALVLFRIVVELVSCAARLLQHVFGAVLHDRPGESLGRGPWPILRVPGLPCLLLSRLLLLLRKRLRHWLRLLQVRPHDQLRHKDASRKRWAGSNLRFLTEDRRRQN